MNNKGIEIPRVSVTYAQSGATMLVNEFGMRPMQERAYEKRGEQYLLIKSPPASGKSRALMFIALDKLANQGVKQAVIVVPERTIGASFRSTKLSEHGFWADWEVKPRWNLTDSSGTDGGMVASVGAFLESDDEILVCTHATFRFAVDEFGTQAFDDRLIAIDEFHHVSANPDNKLGAQMKEFIERDKTHLVAMTGSYFRGDAIPVLMPEDEERFETVTYTYYEQLNGYKYLKTLDIGYYFYAGSYVDDILKVLNPDEKTIVHIPSVMSRESTKDKIREVEEILEQLGTWEGVDEKTGFQLIRTPEGKLLKIADLVDDDANTRDRVSLALKDPRQNTERDYVDIIIALGMAKEGFDWVWCEHALTVGYRSSLTEVVQIIGRATRDAQGKTHARFTNLIAEPEATEGAVADAVNDTLKAIAASLLMEQVLAPKFNFRPKTSTNQPQDGFDYGPLGFDPEGTNVGYDPKTGEFDVEIKGLVAPESDEAKRICADDINEVVAAFVQDKTIIERGLFDDNLIPQEITLRLGKIVQNKYPDLSERDVEAVRSHAVAAINMIQGSKANTVADGEEKANTLLIDGVRRFALDMRELSVDLIDSINPFSAAYAILSKSMNADTLKQVQEAITGKRTTLDADEARELAVRAVMFKRERGRDPELNASDAWERRMAEGAAAFMRYRRDGAYE